MKDYDDIIMGRGQAGTPLFIAVYIYQAGTLILPQFLQSIVIEER